VLACVSLQVLQFRIEWSVVHTKYRAIHKEIGTSRSSETVDTHVTLHVCVQLDEIGRFLIIRTKSFCTGEGILCYPVSNQFLSQLSA
jgi:hypothetical protein